MCQNHNQVIPYNDKPGDGTAMENAEGDSDKPRVFVASSTEGLRIANAVASFLHDDTSTTVWKGAFDLSSHNLEALEKKIGTSDFGVVILSADDEIAKRGQATDAPRDNVLIELGMLIGALSRERSFIVVPSTPDLRLPTDLLGITPARYDAKRAESDATGALSVAGGQILEAIKRLGPLNNQAETNDENCQRTNTPTSKMTSGSSQIGSTVPRSLNSRGPSDMNHHSADGDNGWLVFARRGWLQEATDTDIREGSQLVHLRYGLGEIVGFSPEGDSHRTATLLFASGLAVIPLSTNTLFRPEIDQ